MTQPVPQFDFHQLDPQEKLELISLLWDSLPDSTGSLPIPEWHQETLGERIATALANPDATVPWEEVKKRLSSDT